MNWREDPIVVVEKHLHALLPLLMRRAPGQGNADPRLARQVRAAAETLRTAQSRLLDPHDVKLTDASLTQFARMAERLDALAGALDRPEAAGARELLSVNALAGAFADEIETTLDALRADFLSVVLERQVRARKLANIAAREVTSISRQIYFISINASVEAARAGEAGRGFAVIGEQIRTLSQDASATLRRLAG